MPQVNPFHEVRFPTGIALGSSGGPERRTEIATLGSGREKRNQRWAQARRRYDAGYGVKDLDALHDIVAFFEARRGALFGFRFRDPLDWKSCPPLSEPGAVDQVIGTGDGVTSEFQLVKQYGEGEDALIRPITKPVDGSILIAVNGFALVKGTDFTADAATGTITFLVPSIPASGSEISAGFEFDVPVRFANDILTVSIAAFTAGEVPNIPLTEIRI